MKQQISFEITDRDSSWRVQIRRDGDRVVIALYWGSNQSPAHEFEETAADFARMAGLIIPEMNHAPK